jgi:hypothetical protein
MLKLAGLKDWKASTQKLGEYEALRQAPIRAGQFTCWWLCMAFVLFGQKRRGGAGAEFVCLGLPPMDNPLGLLGAQQHWSVSSGDLHVGTDLAFTALAEK